MGTISNLDPTLTAYGYKCLWCHRQRRRAGGLDGHLEGWRVRRLEGWRARGLKGWKAGRFEGWKVGRLEGWRGGGLEG